MWHADAVNRYWWAIMLRSAKNHADGVICWLRVVLDELSSQWWAAWNSSVLAAVFVTRQHDLDCRILHSSKWVKANLKRIDATWPQTSRVTVKFLNERGSTKKAWQGLSIQWNSSMMVSIQQYPLMRMPFDIRDSKTIHLTLKHEPIMESIRLITMRLLGIRLESDDLSLIGIIVLNHWDGSATFRKMHSFHNHHYDYTDETLIFWSIKKNMCCIQCSK